jgi:putative intracellular protease/amidase
MNLRIFRSLPIIAVFIGLLLFSAANAWTQTQPSPKPIAQKVAIIILFKMYCIDELRIPKGIFEQAGVKVTVVSSHPGIATMNDDEAPVGIVIDQLKVEESDVIMFVGGYGTPAYIVNPIAHVVAQKTVGQKKILAAACRAPIIPAKAGVLKGKKATASIDPNLIEANGGEFTYQSVETDGNIILYHGIQLLLTVS